MKNIKTLIVLSILTTLFISCDKDNDMEVNFYNLEYRVGLWITADKSDTLKFVDYSNLIRKGRYNEEYSYRIEGETLFIKLKEIETQHPILNVEKNSVKLGNMYITTGFGDNSGTFFKN